MRPMNRLTARAVQTLTAEGRHGDGGGLYLQIKNGGRSWLFMYRDRTTGRLREAGLGPAVSVPLREARQRAAALRLMLADGVDPIADKRARRAIASRTRTFGSFADDFIGSILSEFKNPKHRAQWESTLATYAAPLRAKLLNDITTEDVRQVLQPLWNTKHETARRLRGRIERILSAAKSAGLREGENPARWQNNLEPFFGKTTKAVKHHAAIPYKDMPGFMIELRQRDSTSARALEFAILTAARTGEVTGATWNEFDLKEKLWTVPAVRMKAGRAHAVPLTARAAEILESIKRGKPGDYVFPGAMRGNPLSDMALLECLRDLRDGVTTHGFRSSFRDWCGDETSTPREVAEAALAHTIRDKAEAAYRRGNALDRRRELMDAWEQFLSGDLGGKVVPFARKRP